MLIALGVFYIWYVASKPEEKAEDIFRETTEPRKEEPVAPSQPKSQKSQKRLYRSLTNKKIAGVCGGLGEYFDVDPTWIRLGWLLVSLFHPPAGILVYIILVIVVPYKEQETEVTK
ncbi:MAG: PspC domain-containing protein [Calditrichaeota bacterium]|nr:PspC domain-containing protein [Calditrichota bacterium]